MNFRELLVALDPAGYRVMAYLVAVLWQSSLLFGAAAALAWLLRRRAAALRHGIWVAALITAPLLPMLTDAAKYAGAPQKPITIVPSYESLAPVPVPEPLGNSVPPEETAAAPQETISPAPTTVAATPNHPHPAMHVSRPAIHEAYPWALALIGYGAGLTGFLALIAAGRLRIGRWVRSGRPATDERIRRAIDQACAHLKLRRETIEVLTCGGVPAPLSFGLRRPRVILPEGLAASLSDDELLAVALHELAHVRRRDPLWLALASVMRAVLFFHPLAWVAARQLSALAELCADDAVIEATGAPLPYAKMLARLAEELPARPLSTELATGLLFSKGAFLSRVEAILGDRDRMRKLTRRAAIATVAAIALTLIFILLIPIEEKQVVKVTGDPLPIELVGVVPAGMDEMFDFNGKSLGQWKLRGNISRKIWSQPAVRRDFIFRLPKTSEPVFYLPPKIRPSDDEGLSARYWGSQLQADYLGVAQLWSGGQTVQYGGVLEGFMSTNLLKRQPGQTIGITGPRVPERVDIVWRYYHGRRGPADGTFTGPFTIGNVYTDPKNPQCTLEVLKPNNMEDTAELLVKTNTETDWTMRLFVYRGNDWQFAQYNGGSFGSGNSRIKYRIVNLSLADITKITFNEKPREKIFRNIPIYLPGIKERYRLAYADEMAKRLGDPARPEQIERQGFHDPAEMVKLIDLIRGNTYWYRVTEILGKAQTTPRDFSEADLKKIHAAVQQALHTETQYTMHSVLWVGLWGGWPEFVEPALDFIQTKNTERQTVAFGLSKHNDLLTGRQITMIGRMLKEHPDQQTWNQLLWGVLNSNQRPEAQAALLDLAHSDAAWLWTRILPARYSDWQKNGKLDDKLVTRLVAIGFGNGIPGSERFEKQARALLPQILTPQFVAMQGDTDLILRRIAAMYPPAEATPILIAYLDRNLREWDTWRTEAMAINYWWVIDRIVKYLNLWNGTNLGGLGTDINHQSEEWGHDWQAIAREAIEWSKTGVDPSKIARGWRPGPGSVRVVWFNELNPELSMIALWDPAFPGRENYTPMAFAQDFLNFRVTSFQNGTGSLECKAGVEKSHSSSMNFEFRTGELPMNIGAWDSHSYHNNAPTPLWIGKWHVSIEAATATSGSLDGTRLFAEWRTRYLSDVTSGTPPLVFAMQSREAAAKYVLQRRSYAGWTPAEIALRETMDRDPRSVAADWKPYVDVNTSQTLRAWREFVKRPDLTPEMRIHAWWRIGAQALMPRDHKTKSDYEQARAALGKARAIDPEYISTETVYGTSSWMNTGRTPMEKAQSYVEGMQWLRTRTDAMIRKSARRPEIVEYGERPIRDWSTADPESLKRHEDQLRASLKSMLDFWTKTSLPEKLKYIEREDPAAAEYVRSRLMAGTVTKFIDQPTTGPSAVANEP